MKLACVVGAATKPGRLGNAIAFSSEVASAASDSVDVIDLALTKVEICDGRPSDQYSQETQNTIKAIGSADAVIFGSPVYRATYPGVLKNLLDHLPVAALKDKPVGIIAMAAGFHHYLGVDSHMRFVLAWFGALTLPNSVYLTNEDFTDGKLSSEQAKKDLQDLISTTRQFYLALREKEYGPTPLAAKPW